VRFTSFARSRAVVAARNPPRGTRPSRSRYRLSPRVLAGDAISAALAKAGRTATTLRQGQLLGNGTGGGESRGGDDQDRSHFGVPSGGLILVPPDVWRTFPRAPANASAPRARGERRAARASGASAQSTAGKLSAPGRTTRLFRLFRFGPRSALPPPPRSACWSSLVQRLRARRSSLALGLGVPFPDARTHDRRRQPRRGQAKLSRKRVFKFYPGPRRNWGWM
jgi:hypothetical protein